MGPKTKSSETTTTDLLKNLIGDALPIQTISIDKMVFGSHRPIRESGLQLLQESINKHGLLKEKKFLVQEKEDGKYEVIEGNHRLSIFQNTKIVSEWDCWVIPKDRKLTHIEYNKLAGALNSISAEYSVASTDYDMLYTLRNFLLSGDFNGKKVGSYDVTSLFNSITKVTMSIKTVDTLKKYITTLKGLCGDDLTDTSLLDEIWKDVDKMGAETKFKVRKLESAAFRNTSKEIKLNAIRSIVDGTFKNYQQVEDFCKKTEVTIFLSSNDKIDKSIKEKLESQTVDYLVTKNVDAIYNLIGKEAKTINQNLSKLLANLNEGKEEAEDSGSEEDKSKKAGRKKDEVPIPLSDSTISKYFTPMLKTFYRAEVQSIPTDVIVIGASSFVQRFDNIKCKSLLIVVVDDWSAMGQVLTKMDLSANMTFLTKLSVCHPKPLMMDQDDSSPSLNIIDVFIYSSLDNTIYYSNEADNSIRANAISEPAGPKAWTIPFTLKTGKTSKPNFAAPQTRHSKHAIGLSFTFWERFFSTFVNGVKKRPIVIVSFCPVYGSILLAGIKHKAIVYMFEEKPSVMSAVSQLVTDMAKYNLDEDELQNYYDKVYRMWVDELSKRQKTKATTQGGSVQKKQKTSTQLELPFDEGLSELITQSTQYYQSDNEEDD